MQDFFSATGQQRLDETMRIGMLCVFDFDGTLTPITARPEEASLAQDMLARLRDLSACAPVAILSGRAVADIRPRLDFSPAYVVGNHGLEGVPGWRPSPHHEICCRAWHAQLQAALIDGARFMPGIWIEDKRYTLSLHYRDVVDPVLMERRLMDLFAELQPPPRVIAGKCVFNLLPQDSVDKGKALEQLLLFSGAPSAIYVGDDVTDEHVFRLRRPDVMTVRVERSEESAADFFVEAYDDMPRLLDELIRRLRSLTQRRSEGKI
ncbi:MAG: trehalose-phosphatase [Proteobacteria bacterium]|nr:trehalose-phosphatase [Pseudomonadota bacterium]